MTPTEREVSDPNEGLLRRVWRTPKAKSGSVQVQITGRLRAAFAAFEPRFPDPGKPDKKVDKVLSVNIESSVLAAGLSVNFDIDLNKQYIARVTVGDCSSLGLKVFHDPITDPPHPNPQHGLIWGLVELYERNPDEYMQTVPVLARASTII